jgi:hypothetical protein
MKKFILGIIIGIVLILLFTYLGGGAALKTLGKKTIEVGERVEVYEQALKKGEGEKDIKKKKAIKKQ